LQENNLDDYNELLGNDSDLEHSDACQAYLTSFKPLIQGSNWDKISVRLFKKFLVSDFDRHYAMKFYLIHEKVPINSPLIMNNAYEAIKRVKAP
jgi:hypothetical protein